MPEGDTILLSARALGTRLTGLRVESVRPARLARLAGRRLLAVDAVGKHLYMRFEDDVVLHSHMRMTGSWHLYARGERWRRVAHRATAVLGFGEVDAVLFAAPTCELVAPGQVAAGLGPDILAPGFDAADLVARARASPRPTIAEVLLDQAVCAGIGNIYRCNALWHERVHPFASAAELDAGTVAALYSRARGLMRRSVVGDAFRPPSGVHGRAGRPCSVCGALITAEPLGEPARILFWCPRCQAAPEARPGHTVRGSST